MPINFSEIADAWNRAKYSLSDHQGVEYGNAKDKGGTRIYIEFTYMDQSFHLTMTLAPGGDCRSFHLTPDQDTDLVGGGPKGQKAAGGTKSVKSMPSVYYDFTISGDATAGYLVTFDKAGFLQMSGEDKPQKVYSGVVDAKLEKRVKQFMAEFISGMVTNGKGQPG